MRQKSTHTVRRRGAPRGKPFVKGDPRAGRPKGTPNKVTVEAKIAAAELVDSPTYRAKLKRDLEKRKVHPSIEAMLWHYAKGRPVERHEIGSPGDYSKMSDGELKKVLQDAADSL